MTVDRKYVLPAVVVKIQKARSPPKKRHGHFAVSALKRHVAEIRLAVVVIQRV